MKTTKWNDLKHKTSPECREQIDREAVAELERMELAVLDPLPLPPALIERALREATLDQIRSEAGRRNSEARKTHTGGRNGGRPKKLAPSPHPVAEAATLP